MIPPGRIRCSARCVDPANDLAFAQRVVSGGCWGRIFGEAGDDGVLAVQLVLHGRRPVHLPVQKPSKPLPIPALDGVEHVADCGHLVCHSLTASGVSGRREAIVAESVVGSWGRGLLAFAEERARAVGLLPALRLYTNAAMTENLALYWRLGYEEADRGMDNGFERVFLVKRLVA